MKLPHTDAERVDWLLDLVSLGDDSRIDEKMMCLTGTLVLGKTGREALDFAMDALAAALADALATSPIERRIEMLSKP